MGYSTEFEGVLKFKNDITVKEINYLKQFLGEDCREHENEWDVHKFVSEGDYLSYIDYELTDDMEGIQWDGSEKSYDMVEKINLLTHEMRKKFPNFCLQGELIAQGDECDDRWKLSIDENGTAHRIDIEIRGKKVTCPCCGEEFIIDEE